VRIVAAGVLLFLLIIFGVLWFLCLGTSMTVDPVKVVGVETGVGVKVVNIHGLRRMTAWIEQAGARYPMYEETSPPTRFAFWKRRQPARRIVFTVGKKKAEALKDGPARLLIEAQSNDLRARVDTVSLDLEVNTKPPKVVADGFQHYINQGGSELVRFTVSGYVTESGVRVGANTFRSFPVPGGAAGERFALFAVPWDVPPDSTPVVFARNPGGVEATAKFWNKIFPKKFRVRALEIDNRFLEKVVPQIDSAGSGDLLARFLKINGELRVRNNQTLAGLRLKTAEQFLWSGPFRQLTNSKVESQFADRRAYMYQGKKVDEQVHLGFDLSVTENVEVSASNSGKVVWAADLGIYGNCVVVDHGYGLQSIYAHLSSFSVKEGDTVAKGQTLGRSGSTGLAGGDHLHFSMQLDGVQINPVEWWDEHWIKDRVLSKGIEAR
jgi:murein DD-endopeptidase MepM/ murein hydrolase activator NlpD